MQGKDCEMIKNILIKILRKLYSPILTEVNTLSSGVNTLVNKPEYIKQIERAYQAGYNYHQKLVESDPELLNWITREKYFEE